LGRGLLTAEPSKTCACAVNIVASLFLVCSHSNNSPSNEVLTCPRQCKRRETWANSSAGLRPQTALRRGNRVDKCDDELKAIAMYGVLTVLKEPVSQLQCSRRAEKGKSCKDQRSA
jgi:hypothetical protein